MKKIASKLTRKRQAAKKPTRITNETVAEHREQILAGGRRFKYPHQYTKHRLVINAIVLGFVALVLFVLFCWWQLYHVQTTREFFYRLVRIVPVPVAVVEGEHVRYGSYLLNYKVSETYLNTVENADQNRYASGAGNQNQYDFYKAEAMSAAVADAYAHKIAREKGISISDQQVDAAILHLRQTTSSQGEISQEAYDRSTKQIYGLSPSEHRFYMRERMVRQAVAYAVDDKAQKSADDVKKKLAANPEASFTKLTEQLQKNHPSAQVLVSGWVKKENKDGGLAAAAAKLKEGKATGPIKPLKGDGYYFVRLLGSNKDGEINYEFIKIPLTEFADRLKKLEKEDKVQYFIDVPDARPQVKTDQSKGE